MTVREDFLRGALSDALAVAVQLEIRALRAAGGDYRAALLARLREVQARDGSTGPMDSMQYGGGGAAAAFAAAVQAVAVLAFQPGGVTFGGRTWCGTHRPAAAKGHAVCRACLDEETAAKGLAS